MTEDELNQKFEFITNILADVSVKQQQAEERLAHWENRMNRSDARPDRLERVLKLAIRAGQRERREWHTRHALLEEKAAQSAEETRNALKQLAESQPHTDKRLGALIDIVRQDRERRAKGANRDENGGSDAA